VAVLSLALGIGANATIFSVANAFLLRAVRGVDETRLVRVYSGHHSPLDYGEFRFVRENTRRVFTDMVGERLMNVARSGAGESTRMSAAVVTGNYFSGLGVGAALGRLFAGGDGAAETEPVVVLSHRYWTRSLGGDSSIIGTTLHVNERPFTVVGVAAEGFTSSVFLWRPDAFFPVSASRALLGVDPERLGGSLYVTARLAPDVSEQQANAALGGLMARLRETDPARYDEHASLRTEHARGVNAELRTPVAAALGFLLVVVGLVLLVACANLANLLLARATTRRREIGVRLALGAGRGRLVRQLLTESLVLAVLGGAVGLGMAVWATGALGTFIDGRSPEPVLVDASPDARVLAFTILLCALTALAFGLVPALQASSPGVVSALKDDASLAGFRRSRLRGGLVVLQVTVCTVLLACASLVLRSLANARDMSPGFPTAGLLDVPVELGPRQLPPAQQRAFYGQLLERTRALPGVRSAALAELVPLGGSNSQMTTWQEGAPLPADGERPHVPYFNVVSPGYFATLGIPLLRGREFTAADRDSAPGVVIVNETMAARWWPDGSALGRRISVRGPAGPWHEVVGIARDAKYNSLGEDPPVFMYLPHAQHMRSGMVLHVRAADAATATTLRPTLRRLLAELDPMLPPARVVAIEEDMAISLLPVQAGAALLSLFGAVALLLASLGIYGVTSYAVAQRTRELGVRAALGAAGGDLVRLVMGGTGRLVVVGLALGIALSLGAGRLLTGVLYGVGAADPVTFLATPLFLAAVAALAVYVPARRATRVDPIIAIRSE
jgi:predicted permease